MIIFYLPLKSLKFQDVHRGTRLSTGDIHPNIEPKPEVAKAAWQPDDTVKGRLRDATGVPVQTFSLRHQVGRALLLTFHRTDRAV